MSSSCLLRLPDVALECILLHLTFDEIAHLRVVCHRLDEVCKKMLNKGIIAVEYHHSRCLKSVKSQLPRRESERRNHPLSRKADILTAIETRLSLLNMTYKKYIEVGLCCFIPGKVLDELNQVLQVIDNCGKSLPRAHDFLQELRDISSMAMEHFDEKVAPNLKFSGEKMLLNNEADNRSPFLPNYKGPLFTGTDRLALGIRKLQGASNHLRTQMISIHGKIDEHKKIINEQKKIINEQSVKIRDQEKKMLDFEKRLSVYDNLFAMLVQDKHGESSDKSETNSTTHEKLKRSLQDDNLEVLLNSAKKKKL